MTSAQGERERTRWKNDNRMFMDFNTNARSVVDMGVMGRFSSFRYRPQNEKLMDEVEE